MKIYMVMDGVAYEGESVVEVFANKEDAEQYREELVKEDLEDYEVKSEQELLDTYGQYYEVKEMEVH